MPTYRQASAEFLTAHPALQRFRMGRLRSVILKMCFSFLAVAAISVFLYWQTPHLAILIVGGGAALVVAYRVGMPHRYFGRMCATVEDLQCVGKRVNRKGNIRSMTDALVLVATVRTSDGHDQKLEWPPSYEGAVQVGDVLLQIPGIPYILTVTPHDKVICPFCGGLMPRDNDYCVECKEINMYDRTPANPFKIK